jgi:hypothetical protein
VEDSTAVQLNLAWDTAGVIPTDGWLLLYNLEAPNSRMWFAPAKIPQH